MKTPKELAEELTGEVGHEREDQIVAFVQMVQEDAMSTARKWCDDHKNPVIDVLSRENRELRKEREAARRERDDAMRALSAALPLVDSNEDLGAEVAALKEDKKRILALSDTARLDVLWQQLVAERDALRARVGELEALLSERRAFHCQSCAWQESEDSACTCGFEIWNACVDAALEKAVGK